MAAKRKAGGRTREPATTPLGWDDVKAALVGLRYGQVLAVVHDGDVVQIDRMERRRLEHPRRTSEEAES